MAGSTIVIRYNGTDITDMVLFATASFESQMAAIPGAFEFTVKDVTRTASFVTGKSITLDVDGQRLYGGYVTQVSEKFAFSVVDTTVVADVTARQWVLQGVDYNILFDKLVIRNTSDYLHALPTFPSGSMGGALIRAHLSDYLDEPSGFDLSSEVDDVVSPNPEAVGAWVEQGSTWRKQMEDFAQWGAVYYLNAVKKLIFKDVEATEAHWAFSDTPNRLAIPADYSYKPTIGFREAEFVEDGSLIVNDALIWGGSELTNGIVFARRQNATSISTHGRWQIAERHLGQTGYKLQSGVDRRANVIVNGNAASSDSPYDSPGSRGLVNPQKTARVTWFTRNVPVDPNTGFKSHLQPGDIVDFILYVMGVDISHPLILVLPLRSVRISFPGLDPNGDAHVQFEGYFGLQLSDPWWLWKHLRDTRANTVNQIIATSDGTDTTVAYGTLASYTPTPAANGTVVLFTVAYGYISGTLEVYQNGLRQRRGTDYTETDSEAGTFTMDEAPVSTDVLFAIYRALAA